MDDSGDESVKESAALLRKSDVNEENEIRINMSPPAYGPVVNKEGGMKQAPSNKLWQMFRRGSVRTLYAIGLVLGVLCILVPGLNYYFWNFRYPLEDIIFHPIFIAVDLSVMREAAAPVFVGLVAYLCQALWLYGAFELRPNFASKDLTLTIVCATTALSWVCRTVSYLFLAQIFQRKCTLHELRMREMAEYSKMIGEDVDSEMYVTDYEKIVRKVQDTCDHFKYFLLYASAVSVIATFMAVNFLFKGMDTGYGFELYLFGELAVWTLINVVGMWVSLKWAVRIACLHERIVKRVRMNTACYASSRGLDPEVQALSVARMTSLSSFLSDCSVAISAFGIRIDKLYLVTGLVGFVIFFRGYENPFYTNLWTRIYARIWRCILTHGSGWVTR